MDYLNIPVGLCIYTIRHKIDKQMKLFFYFKSCTGGHFKCTEEFKIKACEVLQIKSVKTFNAHFKWLVEHKWITYNSFSGNYRIIGFVQIARRLKTPTSKGAIFEPIDFSKFKGFISGAVITYCMINKSHRERRSVREKGHTSKSRRSALLYLPHTYLAKLIGVTKLQAQRIRENAVKDGYITVKKNFEKTKKKISELDNYRKYSESPKLKIVNNKVVIQHSDILYSNIILRKKRNLKFVFSLYGKKRYR